MFDFNVFLQILKNCPVVRTNPAFLVLSESTLFKLGAKFYLSTYTRVRSKNPLAFVDKKEFKNEKIK